MGNLTGMGGAAFSCFFDKSCTAVLSLDIHGGEQKLLREKRTTTDEALFSRNYLPGVAANCAESFLPSLRKLLLLAAPDVSKYRF